MILLPLAGKRVLVTRAIHQAGKLSSGLRALGAEPVEVPVLEIRPPESFASFDSGLAGLAGLPGFASYDLLILTSANTVRVLAERALEAGINLEKLGHLKVAAVGEATADSARKAGLNVTFVPESYVAESLVDGLLPHVTGKRVLILRAAVARDVIPDALRGAGADVEVVDAYRNVLPESAPWLLRDALQKGIDAVTFTSSSSVTHLAEAAKAAGIAWPFEGVAAVSIGPITSQTLRDAGWNPAIEASRSDIPGLVEAVCRLPGFCGS